MCFAIVWPCHCRKSTLPFSTRRRQNLFDAMFITFDVDVLLYENCCTKIAVRQTTMWCLCGLKPHIDAHIDHSRCANDYQTQFTIIKSVWVLFSLFHASLKFLNRILCSLTYVCMCLLCSLFFFLLKCQLFQYCQRNEFYSDRTRIFTH